jgi:predicted GH43/DUF377 family glycosyl hydrolase
VTNGGELLAIVATPDRIVIAPTDDFLTTEGGDEIVWSDPPAMPPQSPTPKALSAFTRVGVVTNMSGGTLTPIHVEADPTVLLEGGVYRMWFTASDSTNHTGFGYATSADRLHWSVYQKPSSPDPWTDLVLHPEPTDWDGAGDETANVVRGPDGVLRMYYSGDKPPDGSFMYAIGMATSTDGIVWTKHSTPVMEGLNDWELPNGVLEPSVIYDTTLSVYRMWYAAIGTPAGSFMATRIGYATSTDGVTWQRHPTPVLDVGAPGSWDDAGVSHVNVVRNPTMGFDLFYHGNKATDYQDGVALQKGSIGHAYSPDGLNWTKDASPILTYRPGQWDAWMVGGPSVVVNGLAVNLWYFGSVDGSINPLAIGLAAATYS